MQALLDETQLELRDLAQQIAESIGIANPSDLKDHDPGWATLVEAGLVELRDRSDGEPAAGGVEVAIICEALAGTVAPAPYLPTVVVVDLLSRSGSPADWLRAVLEGESITGLLLSDDLRSIGDATTTGVAWGAAADGHVIAVRREGDGAVVLRRPIGDATLLESVSPTNQLWAIAGGEWETGGRLGADDLARAEALALAGLAADTVGALRAALAGVVEYSTQRVAYGKLIGSFQAVQHIAADAHVAIEGAAAATNYAAWGVDELEPGEALLAARTAKAAAAAIARGVAEDVMQLYGGIGQTWEHIAHLYTRRVLFDTAVLGDENAQLDEIAAVRLGGE